MNLAKGPRPWTIHLFGLAFLIVALIGLYLTLAYPTLEFFKWTKRLPMFHWSEDRAIVAGFSVFTMALFPLVWIYAFGSSRARWVVLCFAVIKVALWWQGMAVIDTGGHAEALRLMEPILVVLAVTMMFASPSAQWLKQKGVDPETFA